MSPRIFVVDDEQITRYTLTKYLTKAGFQVEEAETLAAARQIVSQSRFEAILLDLKLPDGNGLDWLPELRELHPHSAIIMITGAGDIAIAVEAMRRGADNFLTKPIDLRDLEVFLRKNLELTDLRRHQTIQKRLAKKKQPYFNKSAAMKETMEVLELAHTSEVPVLLQGETGTGKGVFARWIHDHSGRSSRPFVDLNCSVLRGELLASELFGHARGAFTSAVENKQGLLDVADGGTLFLDEIGEMDPAVQAQFLKAVEEKRYRRLGETQERTSDFRVICATSRDLEKEVAAGRFRNDLYYRIRVLPVRVPSLKEQMSDFEGLLSHLLDDLSGHPVEITDAALKKLKDYSFPGNIRELKNLLERALLLSRGSALEPKHFPGLTSTEEAAPLPPDDDDEKQILSAIEKFHGDKNQAAEYLGISRATLYRKLRKRPA